MVSPKSFNSFVNSALNHFFYFYFIILFQFFCRFCQRDARGIGMVRFRFQFFCRFCIRDKYGGNEFPNGGFNSFVDSALDIQRIKWRNGKFQFFCRFCTTWLRERQTRQWSSFNSFVDSAENLYTCFIFKYCAFVFSQGILLPRPWENSARRGKA